jgi:hypothetical protein
VTQALGVLSSKFAEARQFRVTLQGRGSRGNEFVKVHPFVRETWVDPVLVGGHAEPT